MVRVVWVSIYRICCSSFMIFEDLSPSSNCTFFNSVRVDSSCEFKEYFSESRDLIVASSFIIESLYLFLFWSSCSMFFFYNYSRVHLLYIYLSSFFKFVISIEMEPDCFDELATDLELKYAKSSYFFIFSISYFSLEFSAFRLLNCTDYR